MTTPIQSPSSPLLPPAANELYVSDSWTTSLGVPPSFSTELRMRVDDETFTPLVGTQVSMTPDQWEAWPADADDEKYILDAIASNMNLTRA